MNEFLQVQSLLRGRLTSAELPETFTIKDLNFALGTLWQCSLEWNVETGNCIILSSDQVHMPQDHLNPGDSSSVAPKWDCDPETHRQDGEYYVGFAHTHLSVHKLSYPGFSPGDFAVTYAVVDNFALVTNGDEVFALVRTADCTEVPSEDDNYAFMNELGRWIGVYQRLLNGVLERVKSEKSYSVNNLGLALWRANRELSELLGFAFYVGKLNDGEDNLKLDLALHLLFRPRVMARNTTVGYESDDSERDDKNFVALLETIEGSHKDREGMRTALSWSDIPDRPGRAAATAPANWDLSQPDASAGLGERTLRLAHPIRLEKSQLFHRFIAVSLEPPLPPVHYEETLFAQSLKIPEPKAWRLGDPEKPYAIFFKLSAHRDGRVLLACDLNGDVDKNSTFIEIDDANRASTRLRLSLAQFVQEETILEDGLWIVRIILNSTEEDRIWEIPLEIVVGGRLPNA